MDWVGYGRGLKRATHIEVCTSLARKIPQLGFPFDLKSVQPAEACMFNIRVEKRADWADAYGDHSAFPGLLCFTDGSRVSNGSGAAFLIGVKGKFLVGASGCVPLGKYATVFQAEQIGVLMAIEFLSTHPFPHNTVNIFVDNRSVLDSLTSGRPVSNLTVELRRALQQLSLHKEVTLHWIPSHTGL